MNSLEAVNAMLTSQQYLEHETCKNRLRLRSGKTFLDLAEEVAYVVWGDLVVHLGEAPMDLHRFGDLTRIIHDVLVKRIGGCEICVDPVYWDSWARTGGGAPTEEQTPPICEEHMGRLMGEFGDEFKGLIQELENGISELVVPEVRPLLHQSVEQTLKPFMVKNLATRYCGKCETEFFEKSEMRRGNS